MLGYPQSKHFISEDLMSAHLEQLKLSSEGNVENQFSVRTEFNPSSHKLNITTVASCPNSMTTRVGRKRHTECLRDADTDVEMDNQVHKRMRLDTDDKIPSTLTNFKSKSRTIIGHTLFGGCKRQAHSNPTVMPGSTVHHTVSDLSSIPEELEQIEALPLLSQMCMSDDTGYDSTEDEETLSYSTASHSSSTSLSSPSTCTTADSTAETCVVWIAPELQSLQKKSLLPASVIEEM